MRKLINLNRNIVFLGGTLLVGLIMIIIISLTESNVGSRVHVIDEPSPSNEKDLENKINTLSTQVFNPASYNTLSTEIQASYTEELITSQTNSYLLNRLKSTYTNLVYNQCNLFLTSNSTNNSRDILSWLTQLENIDSRNTQIDFYRNQIKLFEYYSSVLPNEVNRFIQGGTTSFDDNTYLNYKTKVQNMPGLDGRYSNSSKFKQIRANLIPQLEKLYNDFISGESLSSEN